ncbi:MAG TPA: DUF2442 domain-containing protein [Pyrinomonadaceae bacterium]|nr:DUF2442 domain-containing protein [Pyrinomonadaceae bacterium]
MIKIIEAHALAPYRLYVKFSDGVEGEIDLSALAERGVFAAWSDPVFFKRVRVGSSGRSLDWDEQIDLSADSLYMNLTGKTAQELFPKLATEGVRA